ncbi:DUF2125 domain-containing protein [Pyruvatibacter sp.]
MHYRWQVVQPTTVCTPPQYRKSGLMLNRIPKISYPLLGLLLLMGLYWIYWSTLADRMKVEVENWAAAQSRNGITVTWDDMRARGWPLRLRLELDNLRYDAANADVPWSWTTPEFHAHALPYRLNHIIASAKSPMQVTYGTAEAQQNWEVTADGTDASYVMESGAPARLAIDLQSVVATRLDLPATVGAERLQLHARKADDVPGAVDIALRGADIAMGKTLAPGITDILGPLINHVGIQSRVTANAGDNVFQDIALLQLEGSEIQVSQGTVTWGDTGATGTGKLEIAPDGTSNGRFDTTLKGHDTIVDGLIAQELVARNLEGTLKSALAILSLTSGADPGHIRLPVIIRDSEVFLGPVPLRM